jgi:hypothetical protein
MRKIAVIMILLSVSVLLGQKGSRLNKFFKGHAGTIVIKNMETGEVIAINEGEAAKDFLPHQRLKFLIH